jgi:toxic protein SymE
MQKETHKKVKMQYLHRPSAKSLSGYKQVPFLRLSGNWLEQVGFGIGSIVEIIPSENQLIIKKENEYAKLTDY